NEGRNGNPQIIPGIPKAIGSGPRPAGSLLAGIEACSGDRRPASQIRKASELGQAQGVHSGVLRVEAIEVLERASDERCGYGSRDYIVYNLEVEGHPSYSVNGTLVHNSYVGIKNK